MRFPKGLPFAVLVSGPSGGGKSTLARALSDLLWVPRVSKDVIKEGMYRTAKANDQTLAEVDPSETWSAFYGVAREYLTRGVSIVMDNTWTPGRSEPELVEELNGLARLVQVFCFSPEATKRSINRVRQSTRWGVPNTEDWVKDYVSYIEMRNAEASVPLELEGLTIEVDTTAGYSPSLETIASLIHQRPETQAGITDVPLTGPVP